MFKLTLKIIKVKEKELKQHIIIGVQELISEINNY